MDAKDGEENQAQAGAVRFAVALPGDVPRSGKKIGLGNSPHFDDVDDLIAGGDSTDDNRGVAPLQAALVDQPLQGGLDGLLRLLVVERVNERFDAPIERERVSHTGKLANGVDGRVTRT